MEPRATRSWSRVDDRTTNSCYDLKGFRFMKPNLGDTIWPIDHMEGPRPTPRIDGISWQYGQNLTTAKHGWYPAEYVLRPPESMLHDTQRERTRRTHPEHSFVHQPSADLSTLSDPPQPLPVPEESEDIVEETDNLHRPEAPGSSNGGRTTDFPHSSLEALNALAIPLPDIYRPGGNPQGGDASNDDTP